MRFGACVALAVSVIGLPRAARAADPAPAAPAASPDDPASKPPRPPIAEAPPRTRLPWEQHVELGGGLAITATPASRDGDGRTTPVRLGPDFGFHIRLSWELLRYLWFTGYLVESRHRVDIPAGALGVPGSLQGDHAWMYTFGGRFSPTLPIGSRVRLWVTAGAGWGRIEYPRFCPKLPCGSTLVVRERAASVVEIPIGVGAAFEVIPRWLRIHAELTGSFFPSQTGAALQHAQTIDAAGKMRDVGPMPRLDGALVQTIGLSLVL